MPSFQKHQAAPYDGGLMGATPRRVTLSGRASPRPDRDPSGLGGLYRDKQTRLARWKAEEDLDTMLFDATKANSSLLTKSGRGAPGYAAHALKAFDTSSAAFTRRLNPDIRDDILPRLASGRETLLARAASEEIEARQGYFTTRIEARLKQAGEGVTNRPERAHQALKTHFQAIDDADLTPAARKALKIRAESQLLSPPRLAPSAVKTAVKTAATGRLSPDAGESYDPDRNQPNVAPATPIDWLQRLVQSGKVTSNFASNFRKTNMFAALNAAYGAVTLPSDVYMGRVDSNSNEAIRRTADLTGIITLGAGAIPARGGAILRAGAKNVSPIKKSPQHVEKIQNRYGSETKVYINPNAKIGENAIEKSTTNRVRAITDQDGNVYLWDAYDMTHDDIIKYFGLPESRYPKGAQLPPGSVEEYLADVRAGKTDVIGLLGLLGSGAIAAHEKSTPGK